MAAKTIELIFSKGKKGNAFHSRRTLPFSLKKNLSAEQYEILGQIVAEFSKK